jgi:hypothetical protein
MVSAIALIVLLGGITAFIYALPSLIVLPQTSAVARWNNSGIAHYEMDITDDRYAAVCQWHVEVQDAEVVREVDLSVYDAICSTGAPTVDDLFELIAEFGNGKCGPNGCGCDGRWVVTAHYDQQFGYPGYLLIALDQSQKWLSLESWIPHPCTLIGALPHEITVSGFTPLP